MDRHEWENIKKYRKIFLYEIKLLLSYFVEFFEDSTIVSKEYLSDCIIRGPKKKTNHHD